MNPQCAVVGLGGFPLGPAPASISANFLCGTNYLGLPCLDPLAWRVWPDEGWFRAEVETVEFHAGRVLRDLIRAHAPGAWRVELVDLLDDFRVACNRASTRLDGPARRLAQQLGISVEHLARPYLIALRRVAAVQPLAEHPQLRTPARLFLNQHVLVLHCARAYAPVDGPQFAAALPVWNRGPYWGTLPSLAAYLTRDAGIFRTRYTIVENSLHTALVRLFLCKALPHKCMVRNFGLMVRRHAAQFPLLLPLLMELVLHVLLGDHPSAAGAMPSYVQRMWLVRYFHEIVLAGHAAMLAWLVEFEMLAYFSVQTFMFWTLDVVPPLRHVLYAYFRYAEVRAVVDGGVEQVRAHIFAGRPIATACAGLAQCHVTLTGDFTKLFKYAPTAKLSAEFTRLLRLVEAMNETGMDVYRDAAAGRPTPAFAGSTPAAVARALRVAQAAVPGLVDAPLGLLTPERAATVRVLADRVAEDPTGWCHPYVLRLAGCGEEAVARLRRIFIKYAAHARADNAFAKMVSKMRLRAPEDFEAVQYFLERILHTQSVRINVVPAERARAQEAALRQRYTLTRTAPIPEHLRVMYYCRDCGRMYTPVLVSTDPHCWRSAAIGMNGGKKGAKSWIEENGDSRIMCRNFGAGDMCGRPLDTYPMIGRSILTPAGRFELCVLCGALTTYDSRRMFGAGLVCHCEEHPAMRAVTPYGPYFPDHTSPMLACFGCTAPCSQDDVRVLLIENCTLRWAYLCQRDARMHSILCNVTNHSRELDERVSMKTPIEARELRCWLQVTSTPFSSVPACVRQFNSLMERTA